MDVYERKGEFYCTPHWGSLWLKSPTGSLQQHLSSEMFVVVVQSQSPIWLFATPWTIARQGPLSMGFPRQEYWSGLPFPSPGDLPYPGIEPTSLTCSTLASGFFLFLFFLTNFCLHSALQPFLFPPSIFYSVHVWLFATPWTIARQAPLPMGFPRQEYWSGLPFPTLRDLPDPGIKPESLALAGR